jgi:hypothetical protein
MKENQETNKEREMAGKEENIRLLCVLCTGKNRKGKNHML